MGCLCCRGQEGVRPQGFFFKVSSALPHTLLNRVGASLQNPAAFGGFFRCFWSTFFAGVGVCLLSKHTPTCGAGPACRPCPPWGPVPPLRSCGPLGRPICPQWHSAIPPGPADPGARTIQSIFLSTCKWTQIWTEFISFFSGGGALSPIHTPSPGPGKSVAYFYYKMSISSD